MGTAKHILRAGALMASILAITFCLGCGRQPVSARARPATVTKWKHESKNSAAITKGLIVEQRGEEITAQFCNLKEGPGFVVQSTLADGKYVPERGAIVFPLGMPQTMNIEEWLRAGGPHLTVPFQPKASQLIGTLSGTGTTQFEFARHRE